MLELNQSQQLQHSQYLEEQKLIVAALHSHGQAMIMKILKGLTDKQLTNLYVAIHHLKDDVTTELEQRQYEKDKQELQNLRDQLKEAQRRGVPNDNPNHQPPGGGDQSPLNPNPPPNPKVDSSDPINPPLKPSATAFQRSKYQGEIRYRSDDPSR